MAQIRLDDEVFQRLKDAAEADKRTIGQQIDYLLTHRVELSLLVDALQGGVIKKEESKPANIDLSEMGLRPASGLKPVRTKHTVQSELWAAEKKLKNILPIVQNKAREEEWTDDEAGAYGYELETELNAEIQELQKELSSL